MKITTNQLRKIIIEEYIKEENLTEVDQEEIEKLLRQIQGDKYRSPEKRDPARYKTNDGNTTGHLKATFEVFKPSLHQIVIPEKTIKKAPAKTKKSGLDPKTK